MPFTPTLGREATVADVRTQLGEAAAYALELRSRPATERGESFEADLRSAVDFINFADPIERALAAATRTTPETTEARGGRGMGVGSDESERRSMGRQIVEGEGFAEWASGNRSTPYVAEVRNLIGGFSTGAFDSGSDNFLPVATPMMLDQVIRRRRLFVRDVMSVQSTGLRVIPYIRESSAVTNETGAQMVAEGSAKPEVVAAFETYQAVVQKIAAWLPVTDEIATDAPTLMGYIDNRLTYMLDIREEQQVLSGNGTAPQLEGINQVSGTQTQAAVTGDLPGTVGAAIGLIENVDGDADGVVLNPVDYWTATIKRYSTQHDNANYGGGAPGRADGNITWGLPAVRTRVQTSGTGIVGAWRLGATLFDRQQTTIKVADQHSDFFVRNLKVVLAEKRVALAIHRPDLFVKATIPTS
jgi:HK97 family phage major capsid protein